MTDLDALLESVVANPDDYAPRGVLADWLEERGDGRHAAVRTERTAWRALAGFPEYADRVPIELEWGDLYRLSPDDESKVAMYGNISVSEQRRVAIRVRPTIRPVAAFELEIMANGGAVRVGLARAGGPDLLSIGPTRGVARWVSAPGCEMYSETGFDVTAQGAPGARAIVRLTLRLRPVPAAPYQLPPADRSLGRRIRRFLGW